MSFDRLAPHYRWLELVLAGSKLQRCRTAFLNQLGRVENALLLGEGNGRFLVELRARCPGAAITCLDASNRMLQVARQRLGRSGLPLDLVEFIHTDVMDWQPSQRTFDLIVTHFFLDCFRPDQLERIVEKVGRAAAPTAFWLLADFQIPGKGFRRVRARAIHWIMYAFFRLATRLSARSLASADEFLRAQRFVLCERQTTDLGLLRTDRWKRQEITVSFGG